VSNGPQDAERAEALSERPEPKRRSTLPDDLLFRSDEEAARRLALKCVAAARTAERRLDDPSDREALHDFRVSIRRLRSLLRAYRPQLDAAVRPKDRKRLRAIQQATGGGREAEVALEWLTKQHGDLAPEHLAGLNWLSAILPGSTGCRLSCSSAAGSAPRTSTTRCVPHLGVRPRSSRSDSRSCAASIIFWPNIPMSPSLVHLRT